MPKLRETSPTYKGKPALQQEPWEIPPLPVLPDPDWNRALQSVFYPPLPVESSDKAAYLYFMGSWQLVAWSIALKHNPGLLPKGFKVPRKVRLNLTQQAKFADFLLAMERLCIECHPASTYGLGIPDYLNHVSWFAKILLEIQQNGWDALFWKVPLNKIPIIWLILWQYNCLAGILFLRKSLAGQGKQSRLDEWRDVYKSLRGGRSDTGPVEVVNPYSPSNSQHMYNLIEVCRYKNKHEKTGFRELWDQYLKAYRAFSKAAEGGLVFHSVDGTARISPGSGRGLVALENPVFESPGT